MGNIILILLGTVIVAIGVVMVFDARLLVEKAFSTNETNETTKILKKVGFIVLLIGLGIIYIVR